MAGTTTAAYTADVWTSAGTVDGSQNQWDYAVPVRQSSTVRRTKSRSSHDSTHARSRDRASRGSRSSSLSRHAYAHDAAHLNSRGRHDANLSRRGSEAGSLRGAYGHEMVTHSVGNIRDSADTHNEGPLKRGDMREGIGLYLNELDNENWIHRDKLAKIESEELHQATILFHRRGGIESSRPQRGRNHDLHHPGTSVSSVTTPPTTENGDERQNWDLRRPEEIAADDNASSFYQNPGLRKSSSRIPISTASPAPISPEQLGREFPMQRARGLTNGEEDVLTIGKPRRASEPIVVDSIGDSTPPGGSRPGSRGIQTGQNGPSKKTATKGMSGSGPRKSSAPPATRKATPRSRATSNNQRPTTRSGDNRPTQPVNRPEGDPPWLATMYKPDPRLPPDQQMLPTHARKLQQEQWEKEGKTPTTYDREFAPLAIGPDGMRPIEDKLEKQEEPQPQPEPQPEPPEPLNPDGAPEVPLPSKSPEPNTRPGTGYSTMPKLQEPPAGLTPKWSAPVVTAQEPPEKKGCGCCIVM
ncbi:uncharacterized protein ATNIH1004_008942 [Aspergillus tanneri]|uniref:TeaA receptor TeaR n=1 Tax=Aspergillus tanneri TaxID=1220188 RepID=A0A5M9MCM2_9EURO|nr:uncharacterized protein ATNIH1004_008942 [Aspergillus tanneri]KAA8644735.1 hypothetical protein ATNIH1004_008942 [Aspergillus tanneri]